MNSRCIAQTGSENIQRNFPEVLSSQRIVWDETGVQSAAK